mmetsp:Transcript_20985/g.30823  ORF Transcript_20985/g.30823 Transcript_20985/m.30823 type:complete len:114 (+) Transcript_20985:512-853(+)
MEGIEHDCPLFVSSEEESLNLTASFSDTDLFGNDDDWLFCVVDDVGPLLVGNGGLEIRCMNRTMFLPRDDDDDDDGCIGIGRVVVLAAVTVVSSLVCIDGGTGMVRCIPRNEG